MLNKELLKEALLNQRKIFLDVANYFPRQILENQQVKKAIQQTQEVIVITGVRRCGKSYLLKLIWQKIKKQHSLKDGQFLYLNFEDERLVGFSHQDFSSLIEVYFELLKPNQKKKIYLFFDEIQEIENWEKFINRLRENKAYKIFISGSNACLLSSKIATQLVGRNIVIELYPLSWNEYLKVNLPNFIEKDLYDLPERAKIKRLFGKYLKNGGFPEVIKTNFRPLLQEYLKNIIYRDIVLRHKIKYQATLREMVQFLTANIGSILSLQKISQMLKIKNLMTVRNYLNYLAESFLFYLMPQYSYSVKNQIYNPDKIYLCDIGIYQELSFKFSQNKGKILENFVFNELKRKFKEIYYLGGPAQAEVDFVVKDKNKIKFLIQVCYNLSNQLTKERETESLRKAMQEYGIKQGLILTYDEQAEEEHPEGKINIIPVWKWLLEDTKSR